MSLILLDLVLGEGAHADPAAELAPAVEEALAARAAGEGGALEVVIHLLGTPEDPQDLLAQGRRLERAGARVVSDGPAAAAQVLERLWKPRAASGGLGDGVELVGPQGLVAINLGLESFAESLRDQGAEVVQVDWRPPAGGDAELAALLDRMRGGSEAEGRAAG